MLNKILSESESESESLFIVWLTINLKMLVF